MYFDALRSCCNCEAPLAIECHYKSIQAAPADCGFYDSRYHGFGGVVSSYESMTLDRVIFRNLRSALGGAFMTGRLLMLARNCTFASNKLEIAVARGSAVYIDTMTANLTVVPDQHFSPHLTNQEARARVMPLTQAPLDKFLQANDTTFVNLRKVLHNTAVLTSS